MKFSTTMRILSTVAFIFAVIGTASAQMSFNNVTTTQLNPARSDVFVSESWGVTVGDAEGDHWPDVYVTNHRARPSYYRNNGDGTLIDNTLQVDGSGIFTMTRNEDRHGASFSDFDGDGDHDLFSMQAGRGGQSFTTHEPLFIVGPDGRFTDEGLSRGVRYFWGHSSYAFDFNADGLSDIVRGNSSSNLFDYLPQDGNGNFGGFMNIVGCGATWVNIADYDGDQIADLLCYQEGTFPKGAKSEYGVWQNDIASIFPTVSIVIDGASADFDNDLDVDVVLVRGATLPNQVLQVSSDRFEASVDVGNANNEFQWTFNGGGLVEVTVHSSRAYDAIFGVNGVKQPQTGAVTTFTLDPNDPTTHGLDSNRDAGRNIYFGYDTANDEWTVIQHFSTGWWYSYMTFQGDASVSNVVAEVGSNGMTTRDLPNQPRILSHQNGQYVNTTAASNMDIPIECGSVVTADFDNDMDVDIYAVCTRGVENLANRLFANQGNGTFSEVIGHGAEGVVGAGLASSVGQGESVGTGDFNNDGFVDLFVVNGMNSQPVRTAGGPHEMILNTSTNSNNWIHLELNGTGGSDINAVGARVVATAGGVSQLRYQDGGFHRWSQNHDRIHFGLGANTSVDLEIRWPDGQIENLSGVASNGHYVVTQGSGVSAVTLATPVGYPAPIAGDECGEAPYWADRDQALFIYKDCATNTWKLRVSGGGQASSQTWGGSVVSNQALSNVVGFSLEGVDVVDNATDPNQVAFSLTTSGAGEDGFDFTIPNGADTCLDLNVSTSSAPVLFGSKMLPITLPYDIVNNSACGPVVLPQLSVTALTVNEADGVATVEVAISSAPASGVSVGIATIPASATGGSDYYGLNTTLTFPAGQTSSQTLQVTLIDDNIPETTENFQIRLFNPSGATIAQAFTDIFIDDDDVVSGPLTFSVTAMTVNESTGVANIEISTSTVPTQGVSVNMATVSATAVAGADFYGKFQTVNFSSGQTASVIVPVTLVNDTIGEPTEIFRIRLFNPVNGQVAQTFTDITIQDDDGNQGPPVFTVVTTTVNEATGTATVDVAVNVAPASAASVKVSTVVSSASNAATKGPGGDFYGGSTTLNFPAGQTANQTFTFPLINDSTAESDELVDIRLFAPVNGTITTSLNPLTIVDDD